MDACRKAIRQYDIKVVILDSISRAGFGDLTENRPVNAIIDALSGLTETWIALAHTPRQDESHVYGGVMFEAGADIIVRLSSALGMNGTLGLKYEITKANDVARGQSSTWAMAFDELGLTDFRPARPYEFPEIEGVTGKPMILAVKDYILEQESGEASASDIAEALELNRGNVSTVLTKSGLFVQTRIDKGRKTYYGVKEVFNQ